MIDPDTREMLARAAKGDRERRERAEAAKAEAAAERARGDSEAADEAQAEITGVLARSGVLNGYTLGQLATALERMAADWRQLAGLDDA